MVEGGDGEGCEGGGGGEVVRRGRGGEKGDRWIMRSLGHRSVYRI